jgi:hypothetical protein
MAAGSVTFKFTDGAPGAAGVVEVVIAGLADIF